LSTTLTTSTTAPQTEADRTVLDATALLRRHADFVWLSLQRLGVREADLEDLLQEVFVVVHRKLDTFDGRSRITTWLFGIAMRVASVHRRRAHVRREQPMEDLLDEALDPGDDPEQLASRKEGHAQLDAILGRMRLEKRAVFVMYEIEELSCEAIAEIVGVPVGTVYSRLHSARKEFQKALDKASARGGSR